MGVVIMLREEFIKRCIKEHLLTSAYRILTNAQVNSTIAIIRFKFSLFISKHKEALGEAVSQFMMRGYEKYHDKIVSKFRCSVKVHKIPWKLRPVVSKVGTLLECVSKWLDYKLQSLMKYLPSAIVDGKSLRDLLISLEIPNQARLFTADAVSMYTNIELDHAFKIIKDWMESLPPQDLFFEFRPAVQLAIIDGLKLVMRYNLMQFGTTYSIQEIGTAMGTSCAVIFANLYYGWHERQSILPKYLRSPLAMSTTAKQKPLLHHARFIDDIFGIWVGTDLEFEEYAKDLPFGLLQWDVSKLSKSVNFLDMTISILDGRIVTRTYQKEDNPYLYITPFSAHPPGMIKGTIYGLVRRYYEQNSEQRDFIYFTKLLFRRLKARGWDPAGIKPIFLAAIEHVQADYPSNNNHLPISPKRGQLFIHMKYHQNYIPRRTVRNIYEEVLQEVILREIGNQVKFTVCYSRPKNIGNYIAKAALFEVEGQEVSKYIAGEL
jgi:hypothetical protein